MDSRRKLNIEIKFVVSDNAIIMSKHIVSKKNEKVIVFQFQSFLLFQYTHHFICKNTIDTTIIQ